MTPIDVPQYPLWLLVLCVLGALTTGMVAGWTFYAALRPEPVAPPPPADDLVPRHQLDAVLRSLTRTQIALDAARDARALRATLTPESTDA